jgi:predicted naringenin-chalcone synthase
LRRRHSLGDDRRAELPRGLGTAERTRLFGEIVDAYFERTYEVVDRAPDDLVHVTCTGNLSPSAAQKLVARRGWGSHTRITHAYQMGCYAALPAVRMAAGFAALGARRVDIVHTELCSLHLDVRDHSIEQLVIQSLFADGLIRYSLSAEGPGLELVAAYERVLADSAQAMSWIVGDSGMQMSLSRDVPGRITRVLREFVSELYRRANLGLDAMKRSVFAVHPGGPKIIDGVRDVLELAEPQIEASRLVLRDHGNMSSATLPHIWMNIVDDPRVPAGTLVLSLAFGPGLTVCGALFEKR